MGWIKEIKLRHLLLTPMITLILISFCLIGVISYDQSKQEVTQAIERQLSSEAELINELKHTQVYTGASN